MPVVAQIVLGVASIAVTAVVSVVAALGGVALGATLAASRDKAGRKHRLIERQLAELYSPLLGLRNAIRVASEFRQRIHREQKGIHAKRLENARERNDPDELMRVSEGNRPMTERLIAYDSRQLREQLLPWYKEMLRIYRENLWLAEPETRHHFEELMRFIDLWDRFLASSFEPGVLDVVRHDERDLEPLYDHIEKRHGELIAELDRGRNRRVV